MIITSGQNKIVKELLALKNRKSRKETGLFCVEGLRFVLEIPQETEIKKYVFSESFATSNDTTFFMNRGETYILSDQLFKTVSSTLSPQGIIAVC